jgi:hypothetical protein
LANMAISLWVSRILAICTTATMTPSALAHRRRRHPQPVRYSTLQSRTPLSRWREHGGRSAQTRPGETSIRTALTRST